MDPENITDEMILDPDTLNLTQDFVEDPAVNVLRHKMLPVVCCCGIAGILLTVVVLSRKTMSTSTNLYLTVLAVTDLLFLFLTTMDILQQRMFESGVLNPNTHMLLNHFLGVIFLNTAHIASVWITVMLTVERYIAICHPMRAIAICTVKRARLILGLILASAFILRIPNFFELEILQVGNIPPGAMANNSSVAVEMMTFSDVYYNRHAINTKLYNWLVDVVFTAIIPFTALFVLNARLIHEIRLSSRYLRYHLAANSVVQNEITSEEFKITLMLIAIVIAFFICQGPYVIFVAMAAIYSFKSGTIGHMPGLIVFLEVAKILVAVKSSCNFVLYCWFSEKFWNTFKRVFCMRHCLPRQQPLRNGHPSNNHLHRPSCLVTRETTC